VWGDKILCHVVSLWVCLFEGFKPEFWKGGLGGHLLFEGFKPEFWKGGLGGHLLCVCVFVCVCVCLFVQGLLFSDNLIISFTIC